VLATQNRVLLLEKRCTTHQQYNKTTLFFLVFGYKVNVRFNFRGRQTQAGVQVLSAILFVSVFSGVITEKTLSKITNTEHIFSAKTLKQG